MKNCIPLTNSTSSILNSLLALWGVLTSLTLSDDDSSAILFEHWGVANTASGVAVSFSTSIGDGFEGTSLLDDSICIGEPKSGLHLAVESSLEDEFPESELDLIVEYSFEGEFWIDWSDGGSFSGSELLVGEGELEGSFSSTGFGLACSL